jgi:hypothetical protein
MDTNEIFYEEIMEAIEERKIKISSSEVEFLKNIDDSETLKNLTKKQREWLDQIHDKISPWSVWV